MKSIDKIIPNTTNEKLIPPHVLKTVSIVMDYVGDITNDYLTIRNEVIRLMAPANRKWFTPRHHSTKRIQLDDNDYQLMAYWESKTGVTLLIDTSRLHNPEWKPQGKRGWNLARDLRKNHEEQLQNTTRVFAVRRHSKDH